MPPHCWGRGRALQRGRQSEGQTGRTEALRVGEHLLLGDIAFHSPTRGPLGD